MLKPKSPNTFGTILKLIRKEMSMSQSDFATMLGISVSHVCRMEKGNRLPSGTMIVKMAPNLPASEKELLGYAGYTELAAELQNQKPQNKRIDPLVVRVLATEPQAIQREVIRVFLKMKQVAQENSIAY